MMLIGLGEPFMDPHIFERIEFCHHHSVSSLLSTNGTFLDEAVSARVLDSPLEQITLSFDGAKKETFEFYRKGAKFEKVRDNFVRFARMKHQRKSKLQVVVQMVKMEGNAAEVDDFVAFWRAIPGVDQIRIKEDETNLAVRPDAGHASGRSGSILPLSVARSHVRQAERRCVSVLPGRLPMLDGAPLGSLEKESLVQICWNSGAMRQMRQLHATGTAAAKVDICSPLLHHHSASGAGDRGA